MVRANLQPESVCEAAVVTRAVMRAAGRLLLSNRTVARVKGTQHALANAIAWAYFMDHRNTGDDDVLAEIATSHGYSRDEALQAMRDPDELGVSHDLATDAAQQGIQGVPFFVFDGKFALSGAQPQEVFERALRIATGEETMPA